MANEFIARKGFISLTNAQITGSLSVTGDVSASAFSGSFIGDGSQLSGIEGFPFTGSAGITGSLTVVGPVNATTFTGDGSQLTGIEGFPYTGSAGITGSLIVNGNVEATSFTGSLQGTSTSSSYVQLVDVDGFTAYSSSVNTAIDSVLDATTPLTATVNTTNTPFTLTSQSIVVADSTDGNLTINLPDLDTIVGTPNQKPIVVYKNDYSQNVIYVNPSGSQLINGASQDIIVSIQLAVIYNPTSAGWVTEGTSAQSLAELELFFVPRTETGSLSVATASYVEYTNVANKPALVSGSGQISFSGITGKPTLVSGSSQISFTDITNKPTGIVSSSVQVKGYNVFATTGSNQFNGSQAITGSLTVTGQVIAQTLNVQQVTSSIIYSSGSNVFGNTLGNTQQFTGSVSVTGSLIATSGLQVTANNNALGTNNTLRFTDTDTATEANQQIGKIEFFSSDISTPGAGVKAYIGAFAQDTTPDAYIAFATQDGSGTPDPVERLRISSEGNVGIGTTPISKFDINVGASGARRFLVNYDDNIITIKGANASGNGETLRIIADNIRFNTGTSGSGTERMRLDLSGNLGLGVTPSAWSVIQAMQVLNTSWGASPNNLILYQSSNIFYDGAFKYITTGTASQYRMNDSGIFSWLQAPSGTAGGTITFTQAMTLDASGRLGIGTPTPSQRLHVANAAGSVVAFLQSTATNGEPTLSLEGRNSSGTVRSATFKYDNADILRIGTSSPISFRFETNDTERMIIFSDGKVFIGSSPSNNGQQLRVNGNVEVTAPNAFRASYDNSDNYHGALTWATLQLGNNGNNRIIGGRTAAGGFLQFYVNTTNDCTNYSTVPNGTLALTLAATGAATFSSSAAGYGITLNHTSENLRLKMGAIAGGVINIQGEVISSGGVYPIVLNRDGGNVGIGPSSPSTLLNTFKSDDLDTVQIRAETNTSSVVSYTGIAPSVIEYYRNIATGVDLTIQTKIALGGAGGNIVFAPQGTATSLTPVERMRITKEGHVLIQKQAANNTDTGVGWNFNDYLAIAHNSSDSGDRVVLINRNASDGSLIEFRQGNVPEGSITVTGTTVSYNGGHLSRYSQTESNEKIEGLVKGTVMSNLDQMAVWINPETGEPYENEQLNCMKISDVEGDKNVAGVFVNWEYDSVLLTNDMNIAMTGDMIIRIAEGVVVEKGDLLISAGDGTAKPQSDDLIRSNTIAKVISNHVTCTYEDGSYCVPCVLMAC